MEAWQRNLLLLWTGIFLTSSSYSMVIPFLPLFLVTIGVHDHLEIWSGFIFSAAFLAGALVSPYWGSLADKYGRKPMIIRSGITLCIIYLLTAFVTNPYELVGLRILQGLLSGYVPSAIALVGTNTPENKVGYAMAVISTSTAVGSIAGPLLGGAISHWFSNRIAFGSAGILVLIATLLVIFWVKEVSFVPANTRSRITDDVKDAVHNKRLVTLLISTMLTGFSIMTIEPLLPVYIIKLGSAAKDASLVAGITFSLVGVASMIFAARWGKFGDRVGYHRVLLIGLIGGGLGNVAQTFFHTLVGFGAIRFIYGAFFCAVFPAINALMVKVTVPQFRGRAFGLNQSANQIGTMLGPVVGGFVGGIWEVHSVFYLTGFLLLLTAIWVWKSSSSARLALSNAEM